MRQNTQNGFTLVELMIVILVIGILAGIAYPSYQESVIKSKRADAKSALLELSVFMERYYTTKGCYNTPDSTSLACVASNAAPTLPFTTTPKSGTANYDLTVAATPTSFTLTATPRTNTADKCGALTLDNTGIKSLAATSTPAISITSYSGTAAAVNSNGLTASYCWTGN